MTEQGADKKLARLLRRSLIPEGYRPRSKNDIEKMLEALRGERPSDEKVARMLRKINGEEPMFVRSEAEPVEAEESLTEQERELAALHRARGEPLPPELEEKLRRMEEKAAEPPEEEEDSDRGSE